METKIKNRTDDQGKPNPRGETQVRELGDVLAEVEIVENDCVVEIEEDSEDDCVVEIEDEEITKDPHLLNDEIMLFAEESPSYKPLNNAGLTKTQALKKFKTKKLEKTGYNAFIKDRFVKNEFISLLNKIDYSPQKMDDSSLMYTRHHKNGSIDVLVENEIPTIGKGSKKNKKGYSYVKLNNAAELSQFQETYEFKLKGKKPKSKKGCFWTYDILSYTATYGLVTAIGGHVVLSCIVGGVVGFFTGWLIGEEIIYKNNKKLHDRVNQRFEKYLNNSVTGIEAIKSATYELIE
ncbi:hypothetical protein HOK51_04960 [Candidatus Woesearchaeota archaeon]|jgi:hypothetical protein|nr:hypothetical protein [Candidatus Woesearchaeota archaeon]MBT7368673.1 hypothetical protein [Candidatus Woesearchaeota archaeon]